MLTPGEVFTERVGGDMCKASSAEVGKFEDTGWATVDQSCATSNVGAEVVGNQSREETEVSCKDADEVGSRGGMRPVGVVRVCDWTRSFSLVMLYCFSK